MDYSRSLAVAESARIWRRAAKSVALLSLVVSHKVRVMQSRQPMSRRRPAWLRLARPECFSLAAELGISLESRRVCCAKAALQQLFDVDLLGFLRKVSRVASFHVF